MIWLFAHIGDALDRLFEKFENFADEVELKMDDLERRRLHKQEDQS